MLDMLHLQGRNGAMALLESLMIHYPTLYTQITGRQPSIEPSGFSGQSVHFYPPWFLIMYYKHIQSLCVVVKAGTCNVCDF